MNNIMTYDDLKKYDINWLIKNNYIYFGSIEADSLASCNLEVVIEYLKLTIKYYKKLKDNDTIKLYQKALDAVEIAYKLIP